MREVEAGGETGVAVGCTEGLGLRLADEALPAAVAMTIGAGAEHRN